MKKTILIIIALFSFLSIAAQEKTSTPNPAAYKPKPKGWIDERDSLRDKKQIRAEIIFKNGDTVKTHIKIGTNLFDPTMLNELSVNKKITVIANNEKIKYKAEEIKSMRFLDCTYSERSFVSDNKELVELLHDGKIKWYRRFFSNTSGNVSSADFMTHTESKQTVALSGFVNPRNKLKEITQSRPDLISFIESMKLNDSNMRTVLKKYDE